MFNVHSSLEIWTLLGEFIQMLFANNCYLIGSCGKYKFFDVINRAQGLEFLSYAE